MFVWMCFKCFTVRWFSVHTRPQILQLPMNFLSNENGRFISESVGRKLVVKTAKHLRTVLLVRNPLTKTVLKLDVAAGG